MALKPELIRELDFSAMNCYGDIELTIASATTRSSRPLCPGCERYRPQAVVAPNVLSTKLKLVRPH
jgi:hypothetical protein